MANQQFRLGRKFLENIWFFVLGLIVVFGFLFYTIVSLPIFLYRWLICEVLGPLCRRDAGKAVTLVGAGMATELNSGKLLAQTRFAMVASMIFEGEVTFEELRDRVRRGWIKAKVANGGGLKYPELQQHIENWMGYLFWKQDKHFKLKNHLMHHKCEESWTEMECEQHARHISEELLNKPFPTERSPWEVHMISSYRNSELLTGAKEMTILVFRFHHCLVDGFGLLSAICDGLLDTPFSECTVSQTPSPNSRSMNKSVCVKSCCSLIIDFPSRIITAIRDLGYAGSLIMMPVITPWYIPEEKRTGRLLYTRSRKIPMSKLKFIKDKLGVNFTATLLSVFAAGIVTIFKSKGFPNHLKELPFCSPAPLKGHPLKMRNHWTGTLYKICIDQTLSPMERLKESEKHFQAAKQSTYPSLFPIIQKLIGLQLPFISKAMNNNKWMSSALTNFPGPCVKIRGFGKDVIGMDFGVGLLYGVCGHGFAVLSYDDHIRISMVSENAAMTRIELDELIKTIFDEIDKLYELAQNVKSGAVRMTIKEGL